MRRAGSSTSERLRLWLERGPGGYRLRDAAADRPVREDDPRIHVVPVAGVSYRPEALQDEAFAPGRRLALVPEPRNEHDPHAIGVWDAARRLQAGYVPADVAPALELPLQALSLWEWREGGRRVGLRMLVAAPAVWIGRPRPRR